MPLTLTPRALERQGKLAYQGWAYRMFLALDPLATLTNNSLASAWLDLEVSGDGYNPLSGIVEAGTFNSATGRWEQPAISWGFTGEGTGYSFTHRCLQLSRVTTDVADVEIAAILSNVATVNTIAAHGFEVGYEVLIAGATGSFNGLHTVATVPAPDSFTFAITAANAAGSAVGGTVTRTEPEQYLEGLQAYSPAVVLAAGQSRGGTTRLATGI